MTASLVSIPRGLDFKQRREICWQAVAIEMFRRGECIVQENLVSRLSFSQIYWVLFACFFLLTNSNIPNPTGLSKRLRSWVIVRYLKADLYGQSRRNSLCKYCRRNTKAAAFCQHEVFVEGSCDDFQHALTSQRKGNHARKKKYAKEKKIAVTVRNFHDCCTRCLTLPKQPSQAA